VNVNRRSFLEGVTGCIIMAASGFTPSGAWSALRDEKKGVSILAGTIQLPGPGRTLQGYLARPHGRNLCAAVLVVHGEHGLDEETRAKALHYARTGVAALAVDHLSRFGGTESLASSEATARRVRTLARVEVMADLDAAFQFLESHPSVRREQVGIAGSGWGTQMARAYAEANLKVRTDVVPYMA
jgi:carboxymethylenebutenolidase